MTFIKDNKSSNPNKDVSVILPISVPLPKLFKMNLVIVVELLLVVAAGYESGFFTGLILLWLLILTKIVGLSVVHHKHKELHGKTVLERMKEEAKEKRDAEKYSSPCGEIFLGKGQKCEL